MISRVPIQCIMEEIDYRKTSKLTSWAYIFKDFFQWANMQGEVGKSYFGEKFYPG